MTKSEGITKPNDETALNFLRHLSFVIRHLSSLRKAGCKHLSGGAFLVRCVAMLRFLVCAAFVLSAWPAAAAERYFDFSGARLNEAPPGFRSTVSGEGRPGEWKIVEDQASTEATPTNVNPSVTVRRQVLAQLSRDTTDEHFPLLIFEGETFGDFALTTRFKTVSGSVEQMAGIAFRVKDEKNYYVVRASSLGRSFRFYEVVEGLRRAPIGPEIEIPSGIWHELAVDCKGNQIRCSLDRKELFAVNNNTFTEGKVGFWTKSDSVSYFGDTKIVYTPRETLAVMLVRQALKKYPRLLGLKIYGTTGARKELHVVASDDAKELGRRAGTVEEDVVARDVVYCGRERKETLVTLPLHDRNGDAIAAVRVILQPFPGQTEQAALARARPIVKEMETRVRSAKDLTD